MLESSKQSKNDFNVAIDDLITKYEKETHSSLESNIKVSFVPQTALENWMECKKLPYQYGPIEIQYLATPTGDSLTLDSWLKQNAADTTIQHIEITSGKTTYDEEQLIKLKKITRNNLHLTDRGHFSFRFELPSKDADFKFFARTDRYAPITIYYPYLGPSPKSDCPDDALKNLQKVIPPEVFLPVGWGRGYEPKSFLEVWDTLPTKCAGKRVTYTIDIGTYYKWATYFYTYQIWVNDKKVWDFGNGSPDHPLVIGVDRQKYETTS